MTPSSGVCVTGLGLVSPLGLTVADSWEALIHGRSGIGPLTRFDASALPTRIAGEVRAVFGPKTPPTSATKSMTRHMLGAAGGAEAVFTVLALVHSLLPPTINVEDQDPACPIDVVPNVARESRIDVALSNGFGFGGTNASLIFRRPLR